MQNVDLRVQLYNLNQNMHDLLDALLRMQVCRISDQAERSFSFLMRRGVIESVLVSEMQLGFPSET